MSALMKKRSKERMIDYLYYYKEHSKVSLKTLVALFLSRRTVELKSVEMNNSSKAGNRGDNLVVCRAVIVLAIVKRLKKAIPD